MIGAATEEEGDYVGMKTKTAKKIRFDTVFPFNSSEECWEIRVFRNEIKCLWRMI